MEGRLAVPFHFAVEFLVLVVTTGALIDALRARRRGAGVTALGQAFGFGLLAASAVLHGSLIARAEADQVVVALRAIAFVVLATAVRPAPEGAHRVAPAGAMAALFVPGAQQMLSFVPAAGALAVAARGIQAHRRDQHPTTFAFAAAFLSFAAAEAMNALAPADGGVIVGVAHGARALGALFLARWLWASVITSVRMRFVAALVAVLAITVMLVGGAVNLVMADRIEQDQLERLAALGDARVQSIYALAESANDSARLFSQSSTAVREGVRAPASPQQRRAFEAQLTRLTDLFNLDFVVAVDARGRVRAAAERVDAARTRPIPEARAIALAGLAVVEEAPTHGVQVVPFRDEGGLRTELVAVGSFPIADGGRRLGVLAVGHRIDRSYLLRVRTDTGGAEATVLLTPDADVTTTFEDGSAPAAAFAALESELRAAREEARVLTGSVAMEGSNYATALVPVRKQRGSPQVVGLLALSLPGDAFADAQLEMTRTLFLLTFAAMLVAALLAWASSGRVTRPIRALTHAARELRAGNLSVRTRVHSADEVGALSAAFNEMAEELQRQTNDLHRAAETESTLRARMEAVLQSMGDGLIATDADGRVVTFNPAAEEMFGKPASKAVGRAIADVLTGTTDDGRALVDAALRARAASGVATAGTRSTPVALSASPLKDANGDVMGRVIVLRDVSSEHQAERMKSEFLANMSHELRTPITPIKGYAEILARKKFPREKMLAFLESMLESVGRLERIADILIDFAALEAGRLKPRSEPLEVRALIDTLAERWRERDATHRFVRRGGERLPTVLGDQRLLLRSLDELVDNAVKFSPEGGPIEISAEAYSNGSGSRRPGKVRITVRDRGIGIEPSRMPELFQDFRQLDGSETRAYGGLGLGLAYVKRIVAMHGGEVEVESKPGKGSAFSVVLPVTGTARSADTNGRAVGKRGGVAARAKGRTR